MNYEDIAQRKYRKLAKANVSGLTHFISVYFKQESQI